MAAPIEPIELVHHDENWRGEFVRIAESLRGAFGEGARRIDHIGSTAIPPIDAKPVIDIQISLLSFDPEATWLTPMQSLGYVFRRENPERTKRYFRESPGTRRTHIHIRRLGSWHEQFALLFRDYLRIHSEDRRKYEAEKHRLALLYHLEREKYTDGKDPIFWEIMRRADRWAAATGWQPGPSDA